MYAYFAFKLFWHDPKWPLIEREMYKTLKSAPPVHLYIYNIMGSLRDRKVACSASDRQGSSYVSEGRCHLILLTIIKMFSWPCLAYMYTNVA